jgi:hypothetical protein
MEQEYYVKLFNPFYKIGLVSWREAWLFESDFPEKLFTEVHKGKLVFRKKGSTVRISYRQLKKGLIKKRILIKQPPPFIPF